MTAREALFYLTSGRSNDPRRADAAAVLNGLVVRDEHRTPQERRDDYEAVADAVRGETEAARSWNSRASPSAPASRS